MPKSHYMRLLKLPHIIIVLISFTQPVCWKYMNPLFKKSSHASFAIRYQWCSSVGVSLIFCQQPHRIDLVGYTTCCCRPSTQNIQAKPNQPNNNLVLIGQVYGFNHQSLLAGETLPANHEEDEKGSELREA